MMRCIMASIPSGAAKDRDSQAIAHDDLCWVGESLPAQLSPLTMVPRDADRHSHRCDNDLAEI
jgi:hypothetical protein